MISLLITLQIISELKNVSGFSQSEYSSPPALTVHFIISDVGSQ